MYLIKFLDTLAKSLFCVHIVLYIFIIVIFITEIFEKKKKKIFIY